MDAEPLILDRMRMLLAQLDAQRLVHRFEGVDVSCIEDVVVRRPARFGGEIQSQHRSAPGSHPMLKVAVSDGTGTALVVFTGRTRIRGFEVGRAVLFEGVARREGDRLIVINAAYTLLP